MIDRLQQAMQAQRAAINAVPVNEAAVRQAAAALAAVEADMAVDQARMHADIFSILTVEQQEKAKQLEAQGQARAQERRQRAPRAKKTRPGSGCRFQGFRVRCQGQGWSRNQVCRFSPAPSGIGLH